jgi:hypothetical protein
VEVGVAEDRFGVAPDGDGFREDRHHLEDCFQDADVFLGGAVVWTPAGVGGLVVSYLADALVDEIAAQLGEGPP